MLVFCQNQISRCQVLVCALALFVYSGTAANAGEKKILLRNETIVTSGLQRQSLRAMAATESTPGRRLFLVQIADQPPTDWQKQLESLGVDLLRPVPQDAYVTELEGTDLNKVASLSFVQWVGPYRSDLKTHASVQQ